MNNILNYFQFGVQQISAINMTTDTDKTPMSVTSDGAPEGKNCLQGISFQPHTKHYVKIVSSSSDLAAYVSYVSAEAINEEQIKRDKTS